MEVLRPWQGDLLPFLEKYDKRAIHIVYDKIGNCGKSSFSHYLMCHYDAEELMLSDDFKDIMRMAYCVGPKKIYIADMPRSLDKRKLRNFFAAVEKLKSGYCCEDRYGFKRRLMDRPNIIIFTNDIPDPSLLSKDMWNLWTITNGQELVKFDPIEEINKETDKAIEKLDIESISDVELNSEYELEIED